jgi:hypothetical protein
LAQVNRLKTGNQKKGALFWKKRRKKLPFTGVLSTPLQMPPFNGRFLLLFFQERSACFLRLITLGAVLSPSGL